MHQYRVHVHVTDTLGSSRSTGIVYRKDNGARESTTASRYVCYWRAALRMDAISSVSLLRNWRELAERSSTSFLEYRGTTWLLLRSNWPPTVAEFNMFMSADIPSLHQAPSVYSVEITWVRPNGTWQSTSVREG
ncbi:hypothetical protein E1B28_009732 [Marasmius oreades]|uniref:Uncharacterized protein n=1 Tax=Marasmius oreades TaxID=181124 RepID=A0A9P7RVW1_9AGAR|nr:uncharacterized protein E1B28_009732 [Marasmius oreades]KAG7090630.1 hypothetical protein E1B28_009732 [Marasmius oreades]